MISVVVKQQTEFVLFVNVNVELEAGLSHLAARIRELYF